MGSGLARLFKGGDGRGKSLIDAKDKAVYDLKVQRDRLEKYISKSKIVIEREVEIAKEMLGRGEKFKAKLALKKKKYQENLISSSQGKILNLEELLNSIEFASIQQQVFQALKDGNKELERLNSEMSMEEIEQLMEETSEAIAHQQEIDALLSQQLSEQDDEDVLQQLADLEKEYQEENEQDKVEERDFPKVPVSVPVSTVEEETEETQTETPVLLV